MGEYREKYRRWGQYSVPRSIGSLIDVCRINCQLLEGYSQNAQNKSRLTIWDAAGKLRLLCIRKNHNDPLLLDLCRRLNVSTAISPGESGSQQLQALNPESLENLLHNFRIRVPVFGAGTYDMSISELIEHYTEKAGGAHMDWVTTRIVDALHQDSQLDAFVLAAASATLQVGRRMFSAATKELIQESNQKWILESAPKLISKQPGNIYARHALALVYFELGDSAKAQRQLEKCREHEPDWPDAVQVLADLARIEGRDKDAVAMYMRVARMPAAHPLMLGEVAGRLAKLGHPNEGVEAIEAAASMRELWQLNVRFVGDEVDEAFCDAEPDLRARVRAALERLAR